MNFTRVNNANQLNFTGSPGANTNDGLLITWWYKKTVAKGTAPYAQGNEINLLIEGTNWYLVQIVGNLNPGVTNANNSTYNANTSFYENTIASPHFVSDTSGYLHNNISEDQAFEIVRGATQIFTNGAADVEIRQWIQYGFAAPIDFRESTLTQADVRTISGNGTWVAGGISKINIGNDLPAVDMAQVKVYANAVKPTDKELLAIWNDTATASGAYAYWKLNHTGSIDLTDSSGNSRTLTQVGTPTQGASYSATLPICLPVQVKALAAGGASSLVLNLDPVTAGNKILVVATDRNNGGNMTFADSKGNTYSDQQNAPAGNDDSAFSFAEAVTGGSGFTVTVGGLASVTAHAVAYEFPANVIIDQFKLSNTESSTVTITADAADATSENLWIAAYQAVNSVVVNTPTGFATVPFSDDPLFLTDAGGIACKYGSGGTASVVIPAAASGNVSGLLISLAAQLAPVITVQPTNQTAAHGSTATFTTTVTDATSYQWERQSPLGGAWANVSGGSGGTTDDYTTPSLTRETATGAKYRLKASNAEGDTYSNEVTLIVTQVPATYSGIGLVTGASDSFTGEAMTGGPESVTTGGVGSGNVTLAALTGTSAAALDIAGASNKTLAALTSTSAADLDIAGSSNKTLAALTATSASTLNISGSSNQTLAALTSTGFGTLDNALTGSGNVTLAALTGTSAAALDIAGASNKTLVALTATSASTLAVSGSSNKTLAALTATAAAALEIAGASNKTLAALTATSASTLDIIGNATKTLAALTSTAFGTLGVTISGIGNATLAALTANAQGVLNINGIAAIFLQAVTGSAVGDLDTGDVVVHGVRNRGGRANVQLNGRRSNVQTRGRSRQL